MSYTVVIPVYNEGENILATLRELRKEVPPGSAAVLLVYDRDDDTTITAFKSAAAELTKNVALVKNRYGRGALNAIKTGMEAATTDYVVVTMADLCDPPAVIPQLVAKADATGAAIICASRYMRGGKQIGGPWLKGHLSHLAGWILCHIALLPTHDPTNSFKLYRTSFLRTQTIESTGGFELGLELVVKAYKSGQVVAEIPTTWRDRVAGKSNFKLWKWLPHYLHWFFYAFHHINNGNPLCFTM